MDKNLMHRGQVSVHIHLRQSLPAVQTELCFTVNVHACIARGDSQF